MEGKEIVIQSAFSLLSVLFVCQQIVFSGELTPGEKRRIESGAIDTFETITLDDMLVRITEYYDIELENEIKKITTYIEPALAVFMAVVVLFIALAVFLPWWNMYKLFR